MRLFRQSTVASMAYGASIFLAVIGLVQAQDSDATPAATTGTTGGNARTTTAAAATRTAAQATTANANAASTVLTDLPDLSTAATVGASSESASASTATSASGTTSVFHLTGIPTIAGYGIPTMVIPWTAGAPFMKSSNLPNGFVFILVGSILGILALCVFTWRAAIAWSLHRSVRKAAMGTLHYNESTLKFAKPTSSHHPPTTAASNHSMERLSMMPSGKLTKHQATNSTSGLLPPSNRSTSNQRSSSLFFSPTAGAGAHASPPAATMNQAGNRSSSYLPSGYYAAPAAGPLSSLNPMHPTKKGYKPQSDHAPSPPESPLLSPSYQSGTDQPGRLSADRARRSRTRGYERVSTALSANGLEYLHAPGGAPAGQRAPSANLEDMFDHHGSGMRTDR